VEVKVKDWVVGEVIPASKFDLAGHIKEVTLPSIFVAFAAERQASHPPTAESRSPAHPQPPPG